MGTRAIITFVEPKDDYNPKRSYHLYQHWDGYPSGVADHLALMLSSGKCWPLPRYEADEIAAAYVATAKTQSGNIRLAHSRTSAADVAYGYTIKPDRNNVLQIKVTAPEFWEGGRKEELIWKGSLADFLAAKGEVEPE